jgi:hypothetical protein
MVVIVPLAIVTVIVSVSDGDVNLVVADSHRKNVGEIETVFLVIPRADYEKIALEQFGDHCGGVFAQMFVARFGGFIRVVFVSHAVDRPSDRSLRGSITVNLAAKAQRRASSRRASPSNLTSAAPDVGV